VGGKGSLARKRKGKVQKKSGLARPRMGEHIGREKPKAIENTRKQIRALNTSQKKKKKKKKKRHHTTNHPHPATQTQPKTNHTKEPKNHKKKHNHPTPTKIKKKPPPHPTKKKKNPKNQKKKQEQKKTPKKKKKKRKQLRSAKGEKEDTIPSQKYTVKGRLQESCSKLEQLSLASALVWRV